MFRRRMPRSSKHGLIFALDKELSALLKTPAHRPRRKRLSRRVKREDARPNADVLNGAKRVREFGTPSTTRMRMGKARRFSTNAALSGTPQTA